MKAVPRRVYPRACGGTQFRKLLRQDPVGLSPRVRGNHILAQPGHLGVGSIPARAGEPPSKMGPATIFTVYPRACGGT